jgi:hypothetical protein
MTARANATDLVRTALAGTGIELVASCAIGAYDARAPEALRSTSQLAGARGIVVAASAGPALWRSFRSRVARDPALAALEHPYDTFVGEALDRADGALAAARIAFRRFEAAFHAPVRLDFVAMAELVGFGAPGPFALAIHPVHGPWWALRGAWMVDAEAEPASGLLRPCSGCAAPCVGGLSNGRPDAAGIALASPEVRGRCVVGQESRYDDDQIAFHYGRAASGARETSQS